MLLSLDSSVLIYLVEGSEALQTHLAQRLSAAIADANGTLAASRLARLECRVKPLRERNQSLLERYEAVFGAERFMLVDVTASVLDLAAELRAQYRFRTPDAIQLASAIEVGADVFLTGDVDLARCSDVKVEVFAP